MFDIYKFTFKQHFFFFRVSDRNQQADYYVTVKGGPAGATHQVDTLLDLLRLVYWF